jgi:hypothetical protein
MKVISLNLTNGDYDVLAHLNSLRLSNNYHKMFHKIKGTSQRKFKTNYV